jgi:hypothetical protein
MPLFVEVSLIAFFSWLSGFLMADGLKQLSSGV